MGKILCALSDEWPNLPIPMTSQYGNYIPIQREKTSMDAKSNNVQTENTLFVAIKAKVIKKLFEKVQNHTDQVTCTNLGIFIK